MKPLVRPAHRLTRWARAALGVSLFAAVGVTAPLAQAAESDDSSAAEPTTSTVAVGDESDGSTVELDVDTFYPAQTPAPAVVLAHGFGGSKDSVAAQAADLQSAGYVVLTYTARGFGASGGRVHLNDPDFEIADVSALIDVLASDDAVVQDGNDDPRVAVAGGSYGGAAALMSAGADDRVDSVVAAITWNDLGDAFFPQSAIQNPDQAGFANEPIDQPGPFKAWWASNFFTSVVAGDPSGCGSFDPQVCDLFLSAAETGEPSDGLLTLLSDHSPAPVLADIEAPTYLIQGMSDSLFGLDQADANARALQDAGIPVAVSWYNGGHDGATAAVDGGLGFGGEDDATETTDLTASTTAGADTDWLPWLEATLSDEGVTTDSLPVPTFSYAMPPTQESDGEIASADTYPPTTDVGMADLPLSLDATSLPGLINPPGGVPQANTALPGLGALGGFGTQLLSAIPGQSTIYATEPLTEDLTIVGAPQVTLDVTSNADQTTLFLSVWEVSSGQPVLPRRLVAPVQADVTPGESTEITVALPMATWQVDAGSRLQVVVSATDSAFASPDETRVDQIAVTDAGLTVPTAPAPAEAAPGWFNAESRGVAIALALVLLVIGVFVWRSRHQPAAFDAEIADVPLVVSGLTKSYPDGHKAVQDVTWRAERGQVVGLLGPNGAGKTTTLRMVMGLIAPNDGTVHVLGHQVSAGSPVLGRVGALVEGPGFLPHLTGLQNLHALWAATGRPVEEAHFEQALDAAALSDSVHRPVKSYSQGMRQRLGIAAAMLGMPEVLILDEPTNGLDPPQIAAMRPMLQDYAATGRTVIVSSHLLAEVEMTCSHVVVMHAGKVLATGSVAEIGVEEGRSLEDVFLSTIAGAAGDTRLNQVRAR